MPVVFPFMLIIVVAKCAFMEIDTNGNTEFDPLHQLLDNVDNINTNDIYFLLQQHGISFESLLKYNEHDLIHTFNNLNINSMVAVEIINLLKAIPESRIYDDTKKNQHNDKIVLDQLSPKHHNFLQSLTSKYATSLQSISRLETEINEYKTHKQELQERIEQDFIDLIRSLRRKKNQVLSDIDSVAKQELNKLNLDLNKLQDANNYIESVLNYVKQHLRFPQIIDEIMEGAKTKLGYFSDYTEKYVTLRPSLVLNVGDKLFSYRIWMDLLLDNVRFNALSVTDDDNEDNGVYEYGICNVNNCELKKVLRLNDSHVIARLVEKTDNENKYSYGLSLDEIPDDIESFTFKNDDNENANITGICVENDYNLNVLRVVSVTWSDGLVIEYEREYNHTKFVENEIEEICYEARDDHCISSVHVCHDDYNIYSLLFGNDINEISEEYQILHMEQIIYINQVFLMGRNGVCLHEITITDDSNLRQISLTFQ